MNDLDALQARAKVLNLNGLLAHWTQVATESWVQPLIDWEEQERARRRFAGTAGSERPRQ